MGLYKGQYRGITAPTMENQAENGKLNGNWDYKHVQTSSLKISGPLGNSPLPVCRTGFTLLLTKVVHIMGLQCSSGMPWMGGRDFGKCTAVSKKQMAFQAEKPSELLHLPLRLVPQT